MFKGNSSQGPESKEISKSWKGSISFKNTYVALKRVFVEARSLFVEGHSDEALVKEGTGPCPMDKEDSYYKVAKTLAGWHWPLYFAYLRRHKYQGSLHVVKFIWGGWWCEYYCSGDLSCLLMWIICIFYSCVWV